MPCSPIRAGAGNRSPFLLPVARRVVRWTLRRGKARRSAPAFVTWTSPLAMRAANANPPSCSSVCAIAICRYSSPIRLPHAKPPKPRRRRALADVRFNAHYGLKSDIAPCPRSAIFGLMRRSKRHLYSITLSACPSSEGGTARPSALAVLRLTIGSNFVGACTHLGLPYESHRLRAPDRKGSTSEVQQ
jgi:hypothetical protein